MAESKSCAGCQHGDEDITTVSWCSDCSELVCKACCRVHERMSPPHKVVPMEEIQQPSSSLLKLSRICDNHPDQKIALYCCQHDKVICDSCVPVSHQNCKSIISIEIAARGVKDGTALSDLERRISNLCEVTEKIWSQRETTLADLEKDRNKIKKRVSEIKQNMIAHLNMSEANIHKEIDSKYKTCTEKMSRKKNSVQSSSDLLSTWKRDLKSLKQDTSENHLFQVVKFLDAKTYQKELEIREIRTAPVPILKYHPSEYELNIQKLVPDLGTITIDKVQVPMPVLKIDQQCQNFVRHERKLSLSHTFQTTKLGNGASTNKGLFISDERLLFNDFVGKRLFVCTLHGANSNVIDLDYSPSDISLYDNKHAVVAVGEAGFQIIDLTSLKPGRIIKVEGKCTRIATVKNRIWVKNLDRTLTIIDINGKVLKVIQTTFDPFQMCPNQDGDVYCSTFFSYKVYVVTSDGKDREIYKSLDLVNGYGVAVDDHGDVYVAGFASSNLHRISNDGQKHDIVLSADDGINGPSGLSYNLETKELLVVTDCRKSINIYKTT